MRYGKMMVWGLSIVAGITFSLAPVSYNYAADSGNTQSELAVLPGMPESKILDAVNGKGWVPVEGAANTYFKESTRAKTPKDVEQYVSYTAENGVISQLTFTYRTGNKGLAEKKYKALSADMEKMLGHWTCDGLLGGDTIMAGKYNMWAMPQQGAFCKISWNRDNHKAFLKSDTTETVSVYFANY